MIRLIDDETGALIGTVTEASLQVPPGPAWRKRAWTTATTGSDADTLDMLAEEGADKDMIALLRKALGKRER
jgi:hypothetical protein